MANNLGVRSSLALGAAAVLGACSWSKGKIEVGFAQERPFVKALEGDDGVPACMRYVSVTEYDSEGAEREVRTFDIPPSGGCVKLLDLSGARFATMSEGPGITPGSKKKYNVFVTGEGLEVSEALVAS
jgi:hypothetical protein